MTTATATLSRPPAGAAPSWLDRTEPDATEPDADQFTDDAVSLGPVQAANAGEPYAMTDLGNAERLCHEHGDKILWDVSRKVWRRWDGNRWAVDSALRVNRLAADTARAIRVEASAAPSAIHGGRDLGQDLFKHAVRSESRDRLSAMVEVAKSCHGVAVAADSWDADPMLLNVNNGTIDLRTGELMPHDRNGMHTKIAPVDYVPGHTDPRLDKFLQDATGGDDELIEFLQTVTGYVLTGLTVEEILLLI